MDGGVPISDFVILALGDVDEDLGGRVFDVEQFEDGGPVVGDGGVLVGGDHLVHAAGSCLRGDVPRVVLTMSTMASMALMLEMIWPIPSIESVPSLSRRIVGCCLAGHVPKDDSLFKKI